MAVYPLRSATHRRLGGPLPHQLANGTRGRPLAFPFLKLRCLTLSLSGISTAFALLSQTKGLVPHALLTRPPLGPKLEIKSQKPFLLLLLTSNLQPRPPLDLHVLSTPPAFVLSQDQTLR